MSLSSAMNNAKSGLAATARGTLIVAGNLANLGTPGYARREINQSAAGVGQVGGVRIDGITRIVNESLLAELRSAQAANSDNNTRLAFFQKLEGEIGNPTSANGLSSAFNALHNSLVAAAANPDEEIRLKNVALSADNVAKKLNTITEVIQNEKIAAKRAIEQDIQTLNKQLEHINTLNRKIIIQEANNNDASPLYEQRQEAINIVNEIVPVKVVTRSTGDVVMFSNRGFPLLEDRRPTKFSASSDNDGKIKVTAGKTDLLPSQLGFLSGGRLWGNLQISNELAPAASGKVTELITSIHNQARYSNSDSDTEFSDFNFFELVSESGADLKIKLNNSISPDGTSEYWRIRGEVRTTDANGGQITYPADASDSTQILALGRIFSKTQVEEINATQVVGLRRQVADFESAFSTSRVQAHTEATASGAHVKAIEERYLSDGVNSDSEIQKLVEYSRIYAANARVVQTIDEMLQQLERW